MALRRPALLHIECVPARLLSGVRWTAKVHWTFGSSSPNWATPTIVSIIYIMALRRPAWLYTIALECAVPTQLTTTRSIPYSVFVARPAGFEPATLGLAYQLRLSTPQNSLGLWSGLSLHHHRCRTYSLYGTRRKSATNFTFFSWLLRGASTLNVTERLKSLGFK